MLGREQRRDDLTTVVVDADMEFPPGFPCLVRAMLVRTPAGAAVDPEPGTVHDQRDSAISPGTILHDLQLLAPSRQGREVRCWKLQLHQLQERAHQALSLPERQPKHRPQRQADLDRHIRIHGLTTAIFASLRPPRTGHALVEPERHIPAPAQRFIVVRPVRDLVSRCRELVPALGVEFVRHCSQLYERSASR